MPTKNNTVEILLGRSRRKMTNVDTWNILDVNHIQCTFFSTTSRLPWLIKHLHILTFACKDHTACNKTHSSVKREYSVSITLSVNVVLTETGFRYISPTVVPRLRCDMFTATMFGADKLTSSPFISIYWFVTFWQADISQSKWLILEQRGCHGGILEPFRTNCRWAIWQAKSCPISEWLAIKFFA